MFDFLTNNAKGISALGSILGAGGSIYSGIMQNRYAKKLLGQQQDAFDFNKSQILKDEEDNNKSKAAVSAAFGGPLVKL